MRQRPPIRQRLAALVRRALDLPSRAEFKALRQQVHDLICLEALRCREVELLHEEPGDWTVHTRLLDTIRQELRAGRVAFSQRWGRA